MSLTIFQLLSKPPLPQYENISHTGHNFECGFIFKPITNVTQCLTQHSILCPASNIFMRVHLDFHNIKDLILP